MKGGKGDNMTIEKIAKKHKVSVNKIKKEFLMGLKVEKEHTDKLSEVKEIVLDHLTESSEYYTKLKQMENTMEKAGQKNLAKLVKKVITNKNGKKTTVWVKQAETKKLEKFMSSVYEENMNKHARKYEKDFENKLKNDKEFSHLWLAKEKDLDYDEVFKVIDYGGVEGKSFEKKFGVELGKIKKLHDQVTESKFKNKVEVGYSGVARHLQNRKENPIPEVDLTIPKYYKNWDKDRKSDYIFAVALSQIGVGSPGASSYKQGGSYYKRLEYNRLSKEEQKKITPKVEREMVVNMNRFLKKTKEFKNLEAKANYNGGIDLVRKF